MNDHAARQKELALGIMPLMHAQRRVTHAVRRTLMRCIAVMCLTSSSPVAGMRDDEPKPAMAGLFFCDET